MKYLVILKIDEPKRWGQWHSCPTHKIVHSPLLLTEEEAQQWFGKEIQNYPNHTINQFTGKEDYLIQKTVLCLDENKTENLTDFLEKILK